MRSSIFPWVLLGIWSLWLVGVVLLFLATFFSYQSAADGFVITSRGAVDNGTWFAGSVMSTACLGAFGALVAAAASVVCYFFTRTNR
jgi:hypothetical protein